MQSNSKCLGIHVEVVKQLQYDLCQGTASMNSNGLKPAKNMKYTVAHINELLIPMLVLFPHSYLKKQSVSFHIRANISYLQLTLIWMNMKTQNAKRCNNH